MPDLPEPSTDAGLTVRLLVREPYYHDRQGRLRSGRPLALLAYLLMRRVPVVRDELLELLWAPRPGQDVHHRLRTLLYQVRQEIGPELVRLDGREVSVDSARIRCDAVEFLAHLDAGRLDAAIALYQAPFLTRGLPTDAPVFEDWVTAVRARLRASFGRALLAEADRTAHRDPSRHREIADALLRLDPTDRAAAEHSLRAALDRDDAAMIRQAAATLRAAFDAGHGAPPASAVGLLAAAQSRTQRVAEAAAEVFPALEVPLTGRAQEVALARTMLAAARHEGRGGVLAVAGPSGVGKTRLLSELDRLAHLDGARVLRARAYEVDSRTPYAPLVDALRPLFDEIPMRLVPPGTLEIIGTIIRDVAPVRAGGAALPRAEPVQIHAAVAALLERVARDRPLVLLIDDVHWADEQSLACLHRIALRAPVSALVLALAFRDTDERLVAPLFAAVPVELCRLRPLTRAEVAQLLAGMARFAEVAHSERLVRTLLASSGGSPLQLIQHLAHLRQAGLLAVRDGVWELRGPLLDASPGHAAEPVIALIARRLETLSEAERNVLAACAVVARLAAPRDIALVAGLGHARIADQLDALLRQQLAHAEGPLIGVAHAEIGNAALRAIQPHRRQEMFHAALRMLEGDVRPPRAGLNSLARLRLACGAGHLPRARLALLEVLRAAREAGTEAVPAVAESVLLSARDWCPSPGFYAHLHQGTERVAADPARIDHHITLVRHRISARRALLRPGNLVPAALVAAALLFAFLRAHQHPPAELFAGGGTLVLLDAGGTPRALRLVGPALADTSPGKPDRTRAEEYAVLSPDRRRQLIRCDPEAGGPPEVCVDDVGGGHRRVLAGSPGDDRPVGWSPDGRLAMIVSDRASVAGHYNYDLFVVDVATGRVRQNLTMDEPQSDGGRWSPDGTSIAFSRKAPAGGESIVVATPAGRVLRTWDLPVRASAHSWSPDGNRIAVTLVDDGEDLETHLLDVSNGTDRQVRNSARQAVRAWSPDGRFLALGADQTTGEGTRRAFAEHTTLVLVADSSDRVIATLDGDLREWLPPRPPPWVERLEVPAAITAIAGERIRVHVAARAADGTPMRLPALVDLAAADPRIARAAGGDTVLLLQPGHTTLVVSAGGWRTARVPLRVLPASPPRPLLEEDWSRGIDTIRWRHYGSPAAEVVETGGVRAGARWSGRAASGRLRWGAESQGRRAMRNNGDSVYVSGVVTKRAFPMRAGLAIEWTQSVQLTGELWQEIWVHATPLALDRFHAHTGLPYATDSLMVLTAQTPLLVGQPGVPRLYVDCGYDGSELPFQRSFSPTGFDRVLLQAYPSGGCDLFVNGRLVTRSRPPARVAWPDSVRIAVGGRSHHTDVLIGELRVWEGVVASPGSLPPSGGDGR